MFYEKLKVTINRWTFLFTFIYVANQVWNYFHTGSFSQRWLHIFIEALILSIVITLYESKKKALKNRNTE